MSNSLAIVLAAGKGSRMNSDIPKPLHKLNNKTMIYTIVEKIYIPNLFEKIIVVIGLNSDNIIQNLKDFESKIIYIIQKEQKGTGHALKCCKNFLNKYPSYKSLILFADCPLLSIETIKLIINQDAGCIATISKKENPTGCGRIILDKEGYILNSIEEKDCTEEQKKIKLVNVGIYYIKNKLIIEHVDKIKNNNKQKEYYLPDLMIILIKLNHKVVPINLLNQKEFINVNTQEDLTEANNIIKEFI